MRITVINPNTTRAMTESIGACARAVSRADNIAVNPEMGPASIESHFDEALAVPGVRGTAAARSTAAMCRCRCWNWIGPAPVLAAPSPICVESQWMLAPTRSCSAAPA